MFFRKIKYGPVNIPCSLSSAMIITGLRLPHHVYQGWGHVSLPIINTDT
jgi:hypothetical protein